MSKKALVSLLIVILLLVFVSGIFGIFGLVVYYQTIPERKPVIVDKPPVIVSGNFTQFDSEEEFLDYLSESQSISSRNYMSSVSPMMGLGAMEDSKSAAVNEMIPAQAVSDNTANRYSETNVQVKGIDEPDIIKTNGQELFYSHQPSYYWDYAKTTTEYDYGQQPSASTLSIAAFPPDKLAELSEIKETGDLLLWDKYLIILGYNTITAYDISDSKAPKKVWDLKTEDNTQIFQSRLLDGNLYLVTSTSMYSQPSCPMPLLSVGSEKMNIVCTDIYHPSDSISVDSTYTIMKIDPATGKINKDMSFLGTYDSTLYMSLENIYIGYSLQGDYLKLFQQFLIENDQMFSNEFVGKITRLNSYDLSQAAKLLEMETLLTQYTNNLNQDDRLKFDNDLSNTVTAFVTKHKRELSSTMINQIDINNLEVKATGQVPGTLLNQFSLDEHESNLRVATTTNQNWGNYPFYLSSSESVNDVYVLDQGLKTTGSVLDLGKGERIYSVRFIGNAGYVVTFKETDPFYVLDLSNASNPKQVGELKIPGYSSYLHPLSDNLILGVGKEDANVKLSLFDVSNPSQPTEIAKYSLTEYWSDVLDTHHAFMQDEKNQIFFIPGSEGGYIFSYANNTLSLAKSVSNISAQRALFIDNYLYIVGQDEIVVLDEKTYERVGNLVL